ncbi:hypothetical protein BASA61_002861 [Batrachochytrium salamandrivorans]|nr:hypothetical protein BASA61_002861 [Batrachochytrium salamandrivorans]
MQPRNLQNISDTDDSINDWSQLVYCFSKQAFEDKWTKFQIKWRPKKDHFGSVCARTLGDWFSNKSVEVPCRHEIKKRIEENGRFNIWQYSFSICICMHHLLFLHVAMPCGAHSEVIAAAFLIQKLATKRGRPAGSTKRKANQREKSLFGARGLGGNVRDWSCCYNYRTLQCAKNLKTTINQMFAHLHVREIVISMTTSRTFPPSRSAPKSDFSRWGCLSALCGSCWNDHALSPTLG